MLLPKQQLETNLENLEIKACLLINFSAWLLHDYFNFQQSIEKVAEAGVCARFNKS